MFYENMIKNISSHPGSTIGGLAVYKRVLRIVRKLCLIDIFKLYMHDNSLTECVLKQTSLRIYNRAMNLLIPV